MPDANSSAATDSTTLTRDCELLEAAVRDAGALAFGLFRTELKSWIKGASSPVSEADIAANDLLRARLEQGSPGYGWLSEESTDELARLDREKVWIVDPIDGTRSFLAGRDDWCVSAALVEKGVPAIGVVFAPASDECFVAVKGRGATLNGLPVTATVGRAIEVSRLAGPKPLIERLLSPGHDAVPHPRIGSLALRLCRVAEGRIDAAFAGGASKDWDLAAADLVVHEAGGRMTSLAGEPLVYNLRDVTHGILVAAGHERHAHIVEYFRNRPLP